MGNYDSLIAVPIGGQKASASLFGVPVRNAILDLDRRVSAYDSTNNVGLAFATSTLVLASTTETAALTITGVVFKAGLAYEASIRQGCNGTARLLLSMRLRKFNVVLTSGADWGEYYRWACEGAAGASTMANNATLILLNNTAADITSDVNLTAAASAATINVVASAASPRYFTIKPCGFASDYLGLGVQVS
jgi:hypothetical protein